VHGGEAVTRAEQISVAVKVTLASGPALTFDELFSATEARLPDVTATEVDAAARPYESGSPGAYTYRLVERSAPGQLPLW
jgi:hypothetical protein